jgi:hypothetical protein
LGRCAQGAEADGGIERRAQPAAGGGKSVALRRVANFPILWCVRTDGNDNCVPRVSWSPGSRFVWGASGFGSKRRSRGARACAAPGHATEAARSSRRRPARAPACGGNGGPRAGPLARHKALHSLRPRRASGASGSPAVRGARRLRRFHIQLASRARRDRPSFRSGVQWNPCQLLCALLGAHDAEVAEDGPAI